MDCNNTFKTIEDGIKNNNEGNADSDKGLGMIEPQDVNAQELNAMKGDIVGSTTYSGTWIIRTLISLSEVSNGNWTEDLENNLCILWDMTAEQDVVLYLMENNFLDIAKYILEDCTEPRLMEIILGIIGNMCCDPDVIDTIGKDERFVTIILNSLLSDDTMSLFQVLRVLQAVVWRILKNPQSDWLIHLQTSRFAGTAITFILASSVNDNLLKATIRTLEAMSEISLMHSGFMEQLFDINDLICALVESFRQLIPDNSNNYSEVQLKVMVNWLAILVNIIKLKLLKLDIIESNENYLKLMNCILRILEPYKQKCNLIPFVEQHALLIQECVYIILCFQRSKVCVVSEINKIIAIIAFSLKTASDEKSTNEEIDPDELIPELLDNLIRYWLEIMTLCTEGQILEILRLCKPEITEYLMELARVDPDLSHGKFEKIEQAVSSFHQS